jgi:hypothetical protein
LCQQINHCERINVWKGPDIRCRAMEETKTPLRMAKPQLIYKT